MAKPLNRPFRALRALKKAEASAPERPREEPAPASFADAASAGGIRAAPPATARVAPPRERQRPAMDPEPTVEHAFSLRIDRDVVEGRRDDIEPVVLGWLLRQEPHATLDLHGNNAEQARRALHRFVRARQRRGDRVVLVVTGRGRGSKEGGVLRRDAPEWLTEPRMHAHVAAFTSAPPELGGAGALLVLLD